MTSAILRVRIEDPLPFTIADSAIEKGAVLTLTDARTASETLAVGPMIAGIAAREKVASDGRTEIACFRRGWFDIVCSGTINIGDPVMMYNQKVFVPALSASGAAIVGTALEAGSDGEVILVDVLIGAGGYSAA